MNDRLGKALRTAAIVLMGLTAAMNVLGGAGTSCAAFFTKKYPPMWDLFDYRWLYQALVITTVPLGIANIWATLAVARGKKQAYRNSLVLLVIGTILGGIQMYASLTLRGKAVPANMKFYINALTLLVYVLYRLPGIRERFDLTQAGDGTDTTTAGGLAAMVAGCVVLSTAAWAGPSHAFQGANWVHLLQVPLNIGGTFLLVLGLALLGRVAVDLFRLEKVGRPLPLEG